MSRRPKSLDEVVADRRRAVEEAKEDRLSEELEKLIDGVWVVIDHAPHDGFVVWLENMSLSAESVPARADSIEAARAIAAIVAKRHGLRIEDRTKG